MGHIRRLAPFVALVALVAACGPTEIALVATSDLSTSQLRAVEIVVTSSEPGALVQRRCICLAGGCGASAGSAPVDGAWPLTAGLRPGRTSEAPFLVELFGHAQPSCDRPSLIAQQQARVRFRAHRRLLLRMSLSSSCLNVSCPDAGSTCRDGQCASIDFPLDPIDGTDPLAGLDLAGLPPGDLGDDLASFDQSAGDLTPAAVRGPPVVVLSDPLGLAGPPAIASTGSAYQLAVVTTDPNNVQPGLAMVYPIAATGVIGSAFLLFAGQPAAYLAPAMVSDGARYLTQVITPNRLGIAGFVNDPGATASGGAYGQLYSGLSSPFAQQSLVSLSTSVAATVSLSGFIQRGRCSPPTYMGCAQISSSPRPTAGGALAVSRTSLDDMAIWFDDGNGTLAVFRTSGKLTPIERGTVTSSGAIDSPLLLAAASDETHHYAVLAVAGSFWPELRWASILGTVNGETLLYQSSAFDPPIYASPSSLVLVYDDPEMVLVYTDAAGLHELVYSTSSGAPTLQRVLPVLTPPNTGESFDGLSLVSGSLQAGPGAGRYAWRGRSTNGVGYTNVIYTMARDQTRP